MFFIIFLKTLKGNAPDERFSHPVIETLIARPNLLAIQNHPVWNIWQDIRRALSHYEIVSADEIETRDQFALAKDHAWDLAYHLDAERGLRYQMTTVTMYAIVGRTPPVHLLVPGRVFRPDKEDAMHMKLQSKTLTRKGFDSNTVSGFAWGMSLEHLAMIKYGIDDIRKLWQPPYVPDP